MEVDVNVPQNLQDIPSIVQAATGIRDLPGSPWVIANLRGELDELTTIVSRCVLTLRPSCRETRSSDSDA